MLQPKRTKFRREQKGRNRGLAHRGSTIAYGSFALKTLEPGWITSRQIEASRIAVTRYMKREGKVWIRIFPDKPVTSKPAEVRMGKGKGAPSHWVAVGYKDIGDNIVIKSKMEQDLAEEWKEYFNNRGEVISKGNFDLNILRTYGSFN